MYERMQSGAGSVDGSGNSKSSASNNDRTGYGLTFEDQFLQQRSGTTPLLPSLPVLSSSSPSSTGYPSAYSAHTSATLPLSAGGDERFLPSSAPAPAPAPAPAASSWAAYAVPPYHQPQSLPSPSTLASSPLSLSSGFASSGFSSSVAPAVTGANVSHRNPAAHRGAVVSGSAPFAPSLSPSSSYHHHSASGNYSLSSSASRGGGGGGTSSNHSGGMLPFSSPSSSSASSAAAYHPHQKKFSLKSAATNKLFILFGVLCLYVLVVLYLNLSGDKLDDAHTPGGHSPRLRVSGPIDVDDGDDDYNNAPNNGLDIPRAPHRNPDTLDGRKAQLLNMRQRKLHPNQVKQFHDEQKNERIERIERIDNPVLPQDIPEDIPQDIPPPAPVGVDHAAARHPEQPLDNAPGHLETHSDQMDRRQRGVHPSLLAKYTAGSTFSCPVRGQAQELPQAAINDEFCDCDDGADEPGTSACTNSQFFCLENDAYIFSSRVNDGICDCCDGADEYVRTVSQSDAALQDLGASVQCENTCALIRAKVQAQRDKRERGMKAKRVYIETGTRTLQNEAALRDGAAHGGKIVLGEDVGAKHAAPVPRAGEAPSISYGAQNEFYVPSLTEFTVERGEFSYSVRLFGEARQVDKSMRTVSLGRDPRWVKEGKVLALEHGDYCPNNVQRSLTIHFECGDENVITSIDEAERCVYRMGFETPAAC